MSTPTDHSRPLPDGVLYRCGITDLPAYSCAHCCGIPDPAVEAERERYARQLEKAGAR